MGEDKIESATYQERCSSCADTPYANRRYPLANHGLQDDDHAIALHLKSELADEMGCGTGGSWAKIRKYTSGRERCRKSWVSIHRNPSAGRIESKGAVSGESEAKVQCN